MFKHSRVAAAAALAAVVLSGCGSGDSGSSSQTTSGAAGTATSSGGATKAVKIAFVAYAYNDYEQAHEKGMKDAVVPHGGSVTVFNANFDPQKLQQQCADAVDSHRYNVIVLDPPNAATGVPCVTAAKAANVPVVSLENPVGKDPNSVDPQLPGVVGAVVTGPVAAANGLLAVVEAACKDLNPCKVVAEQVPGDPFTTTTNKLLPTTLPNARIVQKFSGQYDPGVIAKTIPDVLSAHRDANVLLFASDSEAIAARPAIDSAGLKDKVKIIGTGGSRAGAQAIMQGSMFGSVGAWPLQDGKLVAEMATKAVNGQKIATPGVSSITLDQPAQVTKATVDQFTPEWGASK